MWKCYEFSVKVSIRLDNGFYVFDDTSAIGKSYLAATLAEYAKQGIPVLSYSNKDYKKNKSLKALLSQELDAVIIDEYDKYEGYCIKDLIEKSKNTIVLVDLKNITENLGTSDFDKKWCTIQLSENCIEVVS